MTLRQWLLILLLSAIWGASFLFLRIAVPQAGVLLTTAARLGFASLLLGLVAWYFGHLRGWPLKRSIPRGKVRDAKKELCVARIARSGHGRSHSRLQHAGCTTQSLHQIALANYPISRRYRTPNGLACVE